ncbi:hypothetical protein FQA39_LY12307 [Lamprigera yunnana]|nr:hypothetical protein FQA39_LY12307 [Lamprigera yunnana]
MDVTIMMQIASSGHGNRYQKAAATDNQTMVLYNYSLIIVISASVAKRDGIELKTAENMVLKERDVALLEMQNVGNEVLSKGILRDDDPPAEGGAAETVPASTPKSGTSTCTSFSVIVLLTLAFVKYNV